MVKRCTVFFIVLADVSSFRLIVDNIGILLMSVVLGYLYSKMLCSFILFKDFVLCEKQDIQI
jgi:hypothetical protein